MENLDKGEFDVGRNDLTKIISVLFIIFIVEVDRMT